MTEEQRAADLAQSPEFFANTTMDLMLLFPFEQGGVERVAFARALRLQGEAAASGDLTHARRMLAAQAATLDRMFHHFSQLVSAAKVSPDIAERYRRLALKAQSQCVQTVKALAQLCQGPRVAASRQAKEQPQEVVNDKARSIPAPPVRPAVSRGGSPLRPKWRTLLRSFAKRPGGKLRLVKALA